MKQQRADAGEQKRRRNGKAGEHGHEHRGSEHRKHVLQTQHEHARAAERRCIVDGIGDGGRRGLGHGSPFIMEGRSGISDNLPERYDPNHCT